MLVVFVCFSVCSICYFIFYHVYCRIKLDDNYSCFYINFLFYKITDIILNVFLFFYGLRLEINLSSGV